MRQKRPKFEDEGMGVKQKDKDVIMNHRMKLDDGEMLEGPDQIKDDIYNNQAGMYETK